MQGYGWHCGCRTATTPLLWVGAADVHSSQWLKAAEDTVYLTDVALTAQRDGPLRALGIWEADQKAPIFLVSNLTDPDAAWAWYRKRFRIEVNQSQKAHQLSCVGSERVWGG